MKLMASLAQAQAEVGAGVVAKADQHYYFIYLLMKTINTNLFPSFSLLQCGELGVQVNTAFCISYYVIKHPSEI